MKLPATGESYDATPAATRRGDMIIAVLASLYTAFLVLAAGLDLVVLSFLFYAPATILFVMTRREQRRRVFSTGELVLFLTVAAIGVIAVVSLTRGWISI